jgi:hypothetical protein
MRHSTFIHKQERTATNNPPQTTIQKAAGSSPDERTTKYLQIRCFAPSNRREGRPVPSVLPLIFFQTASQGACTYDLDVPVLDPVRIHHTTGILQFPVTIDDTLSPILLFLNYCVPTHRKTIRKPFLHYSLRDMGWSGLIGFPCRHSRCRQFDISTSLCPGNSSGGIEHRVPVKEGTGLE